MTDSEKLQVHKEQITPILGEKDGSSFAQVVNFLYHVRMLRYINDDQIKVLQHRNEAGKLRDFSKVRGKRDELVDLGYLDRFGQDGKVARIYRATKKTETLLSAWGSNISLFKPDLDGEGKIDAILKTDVFIRCLRLTYFKHLLFCRFPKDAPYLIPDCLLVESKSDSEYKLTFLEIETDKPYHDDYLNNKRINYNRLAEDDQSYRYFCHMAEHLKLKKPTKEQFCFSILCVGNINKEWEGWKFQKEIN